MSNWAFKNMNGGSSWGGKSNKSSSWGWRAPKNSSAWAFSTPKKKGTYAKHWGIDPERDRVKGFERKKPRFWIW